MRATLAGLAQTVVLALALPAGGMAQDVASGGEARRALFPEGQSDLIVLPGTFLSEQEGRALAAIPTTGFPFYGAVAASPDAGLQSETTVAVGNFHRVEDARFSALAQCDARRAGGTRPCEIVAETRPRGWEPRAIQLSAGATAVFRNDWGRGFGERAFAISPSTGGFALEKGAGAAAAAVAACARASGAADCRVVIAN